MLLPALTSFVAVADFVLAEDTSCLAPAGSRRRSNAFGAPPAERDRKLAVTHLSHVFVAVVSEVQFVGCYDFIASAVIVVWVCGASRNEKHVNI